MCSEKIILRAPVIYFSWADNVPVWYKDTKRKTTIPFKLNNFFLPEVDGVRYLLSSESSIRNYEVNVGWDVDITYGIPLKLYHEITYRLKLTDLPLYERLESVDKLAPIFHQLHFELTKFNNEEVSKEIWEALITGKIEKAEEILCEQVEQHNTAFFEFGLLKEFQNEYEEAIEYYNKSILIEPSNSVFQEKLGYAYLQQNSINKAMECFINVLKGDTNKISQLCIPLTQAKIGEISRNLPNGKKVSQKYFIEALKNYEKIARKTIEEYGLLHRDFDELWIWMAEISWSVGEFNKANNFYKNAITYIEEVLKRSRFTYYRNQNPRPARIQFTYGADWSVGDWLAFKHEYKKLVLNYENNIEKDVRQNNDLVTLAAWINLGKFWDALHEQGKAYSYFRKVVEHSEYNQKQEDKPLSAALRWHYHGIASHYLGDYDDAYNYIKKALEIDLKIFNKDHQNIANHYRNLGIILKFQGEYEDAISYLELATAIELKTRNKHHPYIVQNYSDMARTYSAFCQSRKVDEPEKKAKFRLKAIQNYYFGLSGNQDIFGSDDFIVGKNWENLANEFKFMECNWLAVKYFRNAANIFKRKIYGWDIVGEEKSYIKRQFSKYSTFEKKIVYDNTIPFEQLLECKEKPLLGVLYDKENHKVTGIMPNSSAEKSGIKEGDLITFIDDNRVNSDETLAKILDRKKLGDQINVTIIRGKNEIQKKIILESYDFMKSITSL